MFVLRSIALFFEILVSRMMRKKKLLNNGIHFFLFYDKN